MAKKRGKLKPVKPRIVTKPADSFTETESGTLTTINQLTKLCRLCESKDGPFLNIFDSEKVIVKRIEDIMPFGITENDDLPHKICFRCSAKVEELYEFVQKCVKTQQNLRVALGKTSPLISKTKKQRLLWEKKLSISNISNDDICDAVIKKAMEGIKDPLDVISDEHEPLNKITHLSTTSAELEKMNYVESLKTSNEISKKSSVSSPPNKTYVEPEDNSHETNKEMILTLDKCDQKIEGKKRLTRLSTIKHTESETKKKHKTPTNEQTKSLINDNSKSNCSKTMVSAQNSKNDDAIEEKGIGKEEIHKSHKNIKKNNHEEEKCNVSEKKINIMDYVSTIKVNGVGVLFQCKLCNRNFLKRGVVKTHGCAKTGLPKEDSAKMLIPQEPCKTPVIKYINTKLDSEVDNTSASENGSSKANIRPKTKVTVGESKYDNVDNKSGKSKPKIGPASKVKREPCDTNKSIKMLASAIKPPVANQEPSLVSVQFPAVPNLNCPYKLIPGPNNTFTLVKEQDKRGAVNARTSRKRLAGDELENCVETQPRQQNLFSRESCNLTIKKTRMVVNPGSEMINLDNQSSTKQHVTPTRPYPVGLFQNIPSVAADSAVFTNSASEKHSYTVVQTASPNQLSITAKLQPPAEAMSLKRMRNTSFMSGEEAEPKQPYPVTTENATAPKDTSFFTFVNVDPLLQPSYVLPTDNIQEAQISTSTSHSRLGLGSKVNEKDHYTCNICGQFFTRETKLLAHIHLHYNKMDEEDQLRAEQNISKRTRKLGSKSSKK